jgi:hypothetical protein
MFKIIFYPGTHGNYLEFTLNKLIFGDKIKITNPLGDLGTSHIQRTDLNYLAHNKFKCEGYETETQIDNFDQYFIVIAVPPDDDITAFQLNLKRGEDYNIDPDTITENTYHKLVNKFGRYGPSGNGPNRIIDHINQYTDLSPYYNIKDPSWPDIESIDDYWNLPESILNECVDVFGFIPVHLSERYPNAPRCVLRLMFNMWFNDGSCRPSVGLTPYYSYKNVYKLNLQKFYNTADFQQELCAIEDHFNLTFNFKNFSKDIHEQFIGMVPYKESSTKCQQIMQAVDDQTIIPINLNVVEEGYINFLLETKFNIKMPSEKENYFKDTGELCTYITSQFVQNQDKTYQKD